MEKKKNDLPSGFVPIGDGQFAKVIKYACNTYYIMLKIGDDWYDFTQYEKDDFGFDKQKDYDISPVLKNGTYIKHMVGEYELYLIAEPMFVHMNKPYKKYIQTLLRELPKHQNWIDKKTCLSLIKQIKEDKIKPGKSI